MIYYRQVGLSFENSILEANHNDRLGNKYENGSCKQQLDKAHKQEQR